MKLNERATPRTDAACAMIDLDDEGYPPKTYKALCALSECARQIERDLGEANHRTFVANFPNEQATNCGKCGQYKHTPWRDDQHGYICVTCFSAAKDEEISALKALLKRAGSVIDQVMGDSDLNGDESEEVKVHQEIIRVCHINQSAPAFE